MFMPFSYATYIRGVLPLTNFCIAIANTGHLYYSDEHVACITGRIGVHMQCSDHVGGERIYAVKRDASIYSMDSDLLQVPLEKPWQHLQNKCLMVYTVTMSTV